MSADISNERVPRHLAGTREGLFHILRGNAIVPQEDAMAQADLPRAARKGDPISAPYAIQPPRRFGKSEKEKIANFLLEDEFCFHIWNDGRNTGK